MIRMADLSPTVKALMYVVVAAWAFIIPALILPACGDDDDVNRGPTGWVTHVSPSGQQVECISNDVGMWCREASP